MRKSLLSLAGLLVLNAVLLAGVFAAKRDGSAKDGSEPVRSQPAPAAAGMQKAVEARETAANDPVIEAVKGTAFASVYSTRAADFAAKLRAAGCPEETVRDILTAEIGRRYRGREEDLKPKPGDHLPWGWSAKTHEAKIIERRQQAAAMAREKEGLLRAALGYDVKVPMPTYAMTVSDQAFQKQLENLPNQKREAAHRANEQYWTMVEQLRSRTQGFLQQENIDELQRLKDERTLALEKLQEEVAP